MPTLMVSGKGDFKSPLETSQRPLYALLGVEADRKRHAQFEGGHMPSDIRGVFARCWIGSIVFSGLSTPFHTNQPETRQAERRNPDTNDRHDSCPGLPVVRVETLPIETRT